eukprot:TRINITY_DN49_c0_g1_i1.p1 TRINITY_DN49_c0_g1~~TRINITY_DN49_c0_g1_i1.p1  ORF type:complete len:347 (+),score=113.02 TRINITY_DN49_c0_g1_i1:86-1126(+)
MKSVVLVAMCASLASAQHPFVNPLFYTSGDCTGSTDPASALWSFPAKDNTAVKPFSVAGRELSGVTIDTCLTDSSVAYSVMLTIDGAACPDNGGDSLQLSYWGDSTSCEGSAGSNTTLTEGSCVATPLGSALFNTSLKNESELCVLMNYRTAMETGGVRRRVWVGESNGNHISTCADGSETSNRLTTMAVGSSCSNSNKAACGCCKAYDPKTCEALSGYDSTVRACYVNEGGEWAAADVEWSYTDGTCRNRTSRNPALITKVNQPCTFAVHTSRDSVAAKVDLVAPLTIDIYCQYVQLNARHDVDGYLTWESFQDRFYSWNSAPSGAHPVSVMALLSLSVAVAVLF